jgi:predicted RNase H-like nuclease (RuvC/YqgF family)
LASYNQDLKQSKDSISIDTNPNLDYQMVNKSVDHMHLAHSPATDGYNPLAESDKKLAQERVKTTKLQKRVDALENELNEIKAKNVQLRADVRKLSHGFLTKKLKKADSVITKKDKEIEKLQKRDNFEYQL